MTLASFRSRGSECKLRSSFTGASVRRMNFSTLHFLSLTHGPYLFIAPVKARRTAFGPARRCDRTHAGATVLEAYHQAGSVLEYRPTSCGGSFSFLLRPFLSFSLTRGITVPSPIFYHPFARLSACALRRVLLEYSVVLL